MNVFDFIFPKVCLECGKEGRYICESCVDKVNFSKQVCIECEKPSIDGFTHIKCKKRLSLDGSISLWVYEKVVRKAILKLKYNFAYEIANEFSKHISELLSKKFTALPINAVIVPVPLHRLRENWRGFNQSGEVGKLISKNKDFQFSADLLIRKRLSKPQTELKEKERLKNLKGVFAFNPSYKLLSTNYIIFDDVWTTGSTLKEAGKVLKRNGAEKVWGLTIAR